MNTKIKADLSLLIITLIWGSSFIITKNILSDLPTFNFIAIRFIMSAIILGLIFWNRLKNINRLTIQYGSLVGLSLFIAFTAQTYGLNFTTASKSGFITGLAVILVPLLTPVFFKKAPGIFVIIGTLIAFIGLGFLSFNGDFTFNKGDFSTLLGAVFFASQILLIGKFAPYVDTINSAIVQISITGVLSLIASFLFESPHLPQSPSSWSAIIFLSVLCTAFAFTVQNIAQKYTSPTHTALILTFEPVSAAIFAYLIAGEILSTKGLLGGFLIIMGMIFSEFNLILKKNNR